MEGGIETCDLAELRPGRLDAVNGTETSRLVQRCQRYQAFQLSNDFGIDTHRDGEIRAAVNDSVSNGDHFLVLEKRLDAVEQGGREIGFEIAG
jgi:hypothetical protein